MKRRLFVALVGLAYAGVSFAAAPGVQGPGSGPEAASVVLATGSDAGADGYLEVRVDEYGSWGDFTGADPGDVFNPPGPAGALGLAFTSGSFLFVPERGQKEVLTAIPDWVAVFADEPSASISITGVNIPGDLNGDGVDDAASSSFEMTGGGTDLSVDLTQVVSSVGGGVAQITQTYSITNNEASSITIQMVRAYDGDLLFDGDFFSDEVGTTSNNAGLGPFVFMQEEGDSSTAITISGDGSAYYGGKLGFLPENGPPAYGFGTDVQVFDTGMLPDTWTNHIAGVGYDTDGASGAAPLGCDTGTGCDAFVGMAFDVTIGAGATEEIVITHTYGSNTPGGGGNLPLEFDITGSCPGTTTLTASGGTPNGSVGIIFSDSEGSTPLGAGPCAGEVSGLNNPALFTITPLDGSGSFSLTRTAPAEVCGRFLQLVDAAADCTLSNVTQVP